MKVPTSREVSTSRKRRPKKEVLGEAAREMRQFRQALKGIVGSPKFGLA
jgi:hypothetical protein